MEPSASLIPVDDPSLLWINSGVATMKKYFNGSVVPKNPRLTSSQKSIRTNDIENVGKTARHHTLFEMLGNFSVGDYFKEDAIKFAWELLTSDDWFGWDPDKLYMTVYPKDADAKKFWRQVGVAEDHIVEAEDNFWDIGEGPSGQIPKFSTIVVKRLITCQPMIPKTILVVKTNAGWRFGTLCSRNSTTNRMALISRFHAKTLILGWALNGLFQFSKTPRRTLRLICSCQ